MTGGNDRVRQIFERAKLKLAALRSTSVTAREEMLSLITDRIKKDDRWFDVTEMDTHWQYQTKHRKQKIFRDACLELAGRHLVETRIREGKLQVRKSKQPIVPVPPTAPRFVTRALPEDDDRPDNPLPFFRCSFCFRLVTERCQPQICQNFKIKEVANG